MLATFNASVAFYSVNPRPFESNTDKIKKSELVLYVIANLDAVFGFKRGDINYNYASVIAAVAVAKLDVHPVTPV
jgi:hypothetical protein